MHPNNESFLGDTITHFHFNGEKKKKKKEEREPRGKYCTECIPHRCPHFSLLLPADCQSEIPRPSRSYRRLAAQNESAPSDHCPPHLKMKAAIIRAATLSPDLRGNLSFALSHQSLPWRWPEKRLIQPFSVMTNNSKNNDDDNQKNKLLRQPAS